MNNREYWRERMRALEEKGYRESEAYYEELKKKIYQCEQSDTDGY